MVKIRILALREETETVLRVVHELGMLQPTPAESPEDLGPPLVRRASPDTGSVARTESMIARLDRLLSYAGSASEAVEGFPRSRQAAVAEVDSLTLDLEPRVDKLAARCSALDAEASTLREYEDLLVRLLPLADELAPLEGFETLALVIDAPHQNILEPLRDRLQEVTGQQCELMMRQCPDGKIAALVVYSRRFADKVHALLQGERLPEVHLPPAYHGRHFQTVLSEIQHRLTSIPGELVAAREELRNTVEPFAGRLLSARLALQDCLEELRTASEGLETDHAFALEAWVPERDLAPLNRSLQEQFHGRILVERLPEAKNKRDDDRPVLLENGPLVRPFELLLRFFSLPRYGTLDPTPLLSVFFPLFFGFILADIGYGAILLVITLALARRLTTQPLLREVAQIMRPAALSAIAFGFAFGELFGDLGHRLGLRPLVADRAEAVLPLLLLCIAIGAVQVSLGLVLGVLASYLQRNPREAVARAATLAALVAVFGALAAIAELAPGQLLAPSAVVLAISLTLLLGAAGLVGPLEVFGVIGNVLSYARLLAVGLASLMLADVANRLAGLTGSLILGLIVGVLLHGLNLALGVLSPSVQSLRLQYVEFFGRFYEGGGQPYRPFRCVYGQPATLHGP